MTTTASGARRAAVALLGAIAIALVDAGPARAADAAAGQFKVDTDPVSLTHSGTGSVTGTMTAFHARGTVQAQVTGIVTRAAGGPPCVWAQATFWYANNSTETRATGRACAGEHNSRPVDLHSSPSKDTVRVAVTLRSAVDSTSAGVGVRTAVYYVGDADSTGTAARLDSDPTTVTSRGKTLFTGTTMWRIDRTTIVGVGPIGTTRARVKGTFTWNDVLPSARADVIVTWRYFDGSTATSTAGRMYRGGRSIDVDKASPTVKDVRSVSVSIQPAPSGATTYPVAGASGPRSFGDYYGA